MSDKLPACRELATLKALFSLAPHSGVPWFDGNGLSQTLVDIEVERLPREETA